MKSTINSTLIARAIDIQSPSELQPRDFMAQAANSTLNDGSTYESPDFCRPVILST